MAADNGAGQTPRRQDRALSQTLSNGIRLVEILAEAPEPMTTQALASALDLDRAVVYRLLRTLNAHNLLAPGIGDGRYRLGLRLLTLARGVQQESRRLAQPVLRDLADATGGTAFLGIREGREVVCLISAEAPHAFVAIRYREGLRHDIDAGASGYAIRSLEPARVDDAPEIADVRTRGWAISEQTLEFSTSALSAPLAVDVDGESACVTVLFPTTAVADVEVRAPLLVAAARDLERRLVHSA